MALVRTRPRGRVRVRVAALALLFAACHRGPWEEACPKGDECDEGQLCARRIGLPGYTVTHSICAEPCETDDQCPPPSAGNAVPQCQPHGACRLACGSGVACPAGTVCADGSCMWPR